jgi:hypothetical protein
MESGFRAARPRNDKGRQRLTGARHNIAKQKKNPFARAFSDQVESG